MATLFVARSLTLQRWAAEVGLTKHVYKVGLADGKAEDAVKALNDAAHAGVNDWKLLKKQDIDPADAAAPLDRLAQRQKMVDPGYYPKIRGATGLVKVKIANVASQMLVRQALGGAEATPAKPKPADIAAYLIGNALGG
jgi:hypothetical protein